MCESGNGEYVAVGLPNGLLMLQAATHVTLDSWVREDVCIQKLQVVSLREDIYLICTVDDSGTVLSYLNFTSLNGYNLYQEYSTFKGQEGPI